MAGPAHRAGEDHGVHPSAFQRVSDRGGVHALGAMGRGPVPAAGVAGGDGRAHTAILRSGGGPSGRAHLRRRCDQFDAEHGVGHRIFRGRSPHAAG